MLKRTKKEDNICNQQKEISGDKANTRTNNKTTPKNVITTTALPAWGRHSGTSYNMIINNGNQKERTVENSTDDEDMDVYNTTMTKQANSVLPSTTNKQLNPMMSTSETSNNRWKI